MWFLEKWDEINYISFLNKSFASELNNKNNLVYIYWDKIWILTDENNIPLQYTTTHSWINILDDEYENINTYFWWDVWNGWKSTSTWNVLITQLDSSLSWTLSCWATSYNWYDLPIISHNQTKEISKNISISNWDQVKQLSIKCNNWDLDYSNSIESILSTSCSTSWYVPYNNICVENKCWWNLPQNSYSTANQENHLTNWNYSESAWECSFKCNTNYTYNTLNNTCDADNRNKSCDAKPANSTYNTASNIIQTWNWTNWLPSETSTYNLTSSSSECIFKCDTWYTYDTNSNECIWNNCSIPSSDTNNSKTYTISSPSILLHGNSTTKVWTYLFWSSPSNWNLTANFNYSCNAWVLTKVVSWDAWSCTSWYTFNGSYTSPSCSANNCNLPWWWTINNWQSITAYSTTSATSPTTCSNISQARTCTNWVLSGSYTSQSCSQQYRNCPWTPWWTVPHWYSNIAYSTNNLSCWWSCSSYAQTRTCNDWTMNWSYSYSSCSVNACTSCYLNNYWTLTHWLWVWSYVTNNVACWLSCSQSYISCNNWNLSWWSYYYSSCSVATCSMTWKKVKLDSYCLWSQNCQTHFYLWWCSYEREWEACNYEWETNWLCFNSSWPSWRYTCSY